MSIYAAWDGVAGDQLASNTGWLNFSQWADSLDAETYGEAVHLADHGWCQHLATLRQQLTRAVASQPPKAMATKTTIGGLLEMLKGSKSEVLTVTDGFSSGNAPTNRLAK